MNDQLSNLDRQAWENYWTDGRANGALGCLPDATPEIERLQSDFWKSALGSLPRKSKIVDLATGDGSVLRVIHKLRRDFKLIGVDYSSTLPSIPKPIRLRANVDMESLPFGETSVSAFVSRFGVEYGDVGKIAREVERALLAGGTFAFLMHHNESPIHSINKARAEQLAWALDEQNVITKADAFLRSRDQLGSQVPTGFHNIARLASETFGAYSVATEFCQAVLQTLELGLGKPVQICRNIIAQLNNHSRQEIRRIQAMMAASKNDGEMKAFEELLAADGLQTRDRFPLMLEREGQPIAWAISGQKAGG